MGGKNKNNNRNSRNKGEDARNAFLERIENEAETASAAENVQTGNDKDMPSDNADLISELQAVPDDVPLRAGRVERSKPSEDRERSGAERAKPSEDRERSRAERAKKSEGRRGGTGKRVLLIVLLILLAAAGFGIYRVYTAKAFAKGAHVDGVNVGGMSVKEAEAAVTDSANILSVKRQGEKDVEVKTAFTFDLSDGLERYLKLSAVDPRLFAGQDVDYAVPLTVKDGTEATAMILKEAIPTPKKATVTKNAYIDYDKLRIVDAVQGTDIDYEKLALAIGKSLKDDPSSRQFSFNPTDYLRRPKVTADDLRAELKFAREYLADGLTLKCDTGDVTVTPEQLSKVIKYSADGPKYDMKAAREIASEIASSYSPWAVVVQTQEGPRELANYILDGEVDIEKTAKSIYEAAKNGTDGEIVDNMDAASSLSTRVEVSLSSQTLYVIKDGKVTNTWPVVTGLPGERATVPGIFNIYYMQLDAKLVGDETDPYDIPVSYWMAFNGGAGLHDAVWQSSFGGDAYKTRGSHGCVGMSLENAATLYKIAYVGMPVVIYP